MVKQTTQNPEANVMKAAVIQAMKDYEFTYIERNKDTGKIVKKHKPYMDSVISWVENMNGTFDLCAQAMDMTPEVLQEMMLKKFNRINKGEKVFDREKKSINSRNVGDYDKNK